MHARELIDAAAMVTGQAPVVIECDLLRVEGMQAYWLATKSRADQWCRQLEEADHSGPIPPPEESLRIRRLVEEILLAEPLSRVWAAVVEAHGQQRECAALTAIARGALAAHLDARQQGIQLLFARRVLSMEQSLEVYRLRRALELTCDLLIGALTARYGCADSMAWDPQRAQAISASLDSRSLLAWSRQTAVILAAVRTRRLAVSGGRAANPQLNRQVHDALLQCLEADSLAASPAPCTIQELARRHAEQDQPRQRPSTPHSKTRRDHRRASWRQ